MRRAAQLVQIPPPPRDPVEVRKERRMAELALVPPARKNLGIDRSSAEWQREKDLFEAAYAEAAVRRKAREESA